VNVPLYVVHVMSKDALDEVARARQAGEPNLFYFILIFFSAFAYRRFPGSRQCSSMLQKGSRMWMLSAAYEIHSLL
jgi:hypothetical protein